MNTSEPFYTTKANYNFEKVDIFLRVKGRLPQGEKDKLTKEILIEYCDRYIKGDLTVGLVPLNLMYQLSQEILLEEHGYNYYKICNEEHNKDWETRYKEDIAPYIPKKKASKHVAKKRKKTN